MNRIRIVLVDDHGLVRAGMRALLAHIAGATVVGEADNGRDALALIEKLRPELALIDISMPNMNGLETTKRITRDHPGTRVVILSMHADEEYVHQALACGAAGYLLKNASEAELELAVRAVARGDRWLSPGVSRAVIAAYAEKPPPRGPLQVLTPRQREVLQLIAEGHSTRDIARRLGLGVKTVETHRAQIMDRVGIHDIPGLVRYAIRTHLVSPDV
jgi:DNA-binding NarL/FixJ family response regulator